MVLRDFSKMVRSFLYYPDRLPPEMPPPSWAAGSEEVWMECDDGVRTHGLWWGEPENGPVILFLHGNAQEVYSWSLVHRELLPLECRMLLIDYHGYGKSGGEPHEAGLYLDGRAAMRWLSHKGIEDKEIIIFGKSLGGAVACEIAQGRELKALILESTFTSLAGVASRLFPMLPDGASLGEEYASIDKIGDVKCPILVIHGDMAELIPIVEGKTLFEAAPEPKELYLVPGAGHNDVFMVAGSGYAGRIGTFLDQHRR